MEKDSSHTHQNYRGRMAPVLRAPPMKVGFRDLLPPKTPHHRRSMQPWKEKPWKTPSLEAHELTRRRISGALGSWFPSLCSSSADLHDSDIGSHQAYLDRGSWAPFSGGGGDFAPFVFFPRQNGYGEPLLEESRGKEFRGTPFILELWVRRERSRKHFEERYWSRERGTELSLRAWRRQRLGLE